MVGGWVWKNQGLPSHWEKKKKRKHIRRLLKYHRKPSRVFVSMKNKPTNPLWLLLAGLAVEGG